MGTTLDPREVCGDCLPDEEVAALYPAWATEEDKSEYAQQAYENW